jgi:hypothetical protein
MNALFPSSLVPWREEVNEKIWACGEWEEQTSISDSTNTVVVSDMKLSTQSASLKKPTNQGQKTQTPASLEKSSSVDHKDKLQHDLNWIDVLDMPRWKRFQAFVQSQSSSSSSKHYHSPQMVIVGGTDAVIREVWVALFFH